MKKLLSQKWHFENENSYSWHAKKVENALSYNIGGKVITCGVSFPWKLNLAIWTKQYYSGVWIANL